MQLPNYEKAVINPQKFTDYILSNSHPIGKYKAAYFKSIGFIKENYHLLINEISKLIKEKCGLPQKSLVSVNEYSKRLFK
jgi:hypothetical protein